MVKVKRAACWFVTVGWLQCAIYGYAAYGLVGCAVVPKEPVRTTMSVIHEDHRYTDGVQVIMATCALQTVTVTDSIEGSKPLMNYLYQRCLIDGGATL